MANRAYSATDSRARAGTWQHAGSSARRCASHLDATPGAVQVVPTRSVQEGPSRSFSEANSMRRHSVSSRTTSKTCSHGGVIRR